MRSRLIKFVTLPLPDQILLARAFVWVLFIRMSLWLLPFRIVRQAIARLAQPPIQRRRPSYSIAVLSTAIVVTARRIPQATCLTQGLAGEVLLAREGYVPSLRIGVLKSDGRFKAHAWVECEGRVVIGGVSGIEEFAVLPKV